MKRISWLAACLALGCSSPKEEWVVSIGAAPGKNLASIAVGDTLYMQAIETYRGVNGETTVITSTDSPAHFEWSSSPAASASYLSPGVLHLKEKGNLLISARTTNAEHRVALVVGVKPVVIICSTSGSCQP